MVAHDMEEEETSAILGIGNSKQMINVVEIANYQ